MMSSVTIEIVVGIRSFLRIRRFFEILAFFQSEVRSFKILINNVRV